MDLIFLRHPQQKVENRLSRGEGNFGFGQDYPSSGRSSFYSGSSRSKLSRMTGSMMERKQVFSCFFAGSEGCPSLGGFGFSREAVSRGRVGQGGFFRQDLRVGLWAGLFPLGLLLFYRGRSRRRAFPEVSAGAQPMGKRNPARE
jgi:hypothetical protein